jgi:hypothetical protein
MNTATDNRDVARTAIEQVCARGDMDLAPSCYAEDFADYFASSEYHGLEGVRKSTELYRAYEFPDEDTLRQALVAPAGLAVIVGPEREEELGDAIVAGLAPYRTPDAGYRLRSDFHYLIARA